MYPHHQNGGGGGPDGPPGSSLEDRLRNMILTNNEIERSYLSSPQASQASAASAASQNFSSPTTLGTDGASDDVSPPGLAQSGQTPASPRSSRKRPNQAQRRQMSAQLSIPIDPRPLPPHSAGSYVSPPGYGVQLQHQQNRPHYQQQSHPQNHYQSQHHGGYQSQGGYQHQQRPQSATVRPSQYGPSPTMPSPQSGGRGYPSQPRHQQSLSYQGPMAFNDPYNWRSQQQPAASFDGQSQRTARPHSNSNNRLYNARPEDIQTQAALLERFCEQILSSAEIQLSDIQEKENFRIRIELLCRDALARYELEANGKAEFPAFTVRLRCFGSLSSGFATKASDMDLGLISPLSEPLPDAPNSPIPRIVEKAFLDAGLGARLLTRTRVPIIKLCEKPPEQLQRGLLEERAKWEKGLLSDHDGTDADTERADEHQEKESQSVEEHTPTGEGEKNTRSTRVHHERIESVAEEREDTKAEHQQKDSTSDDGNMDENKYSQCLASFKQTPGQSLANYTAAAKRLVRKLGGRDITHSTARDFKNEDLKILTDACHAFVAGLADTELRDRLFATRSLATSDVPSQLNYRSLYGVCMQAEGERLAMLWAKREIREKDPHQEHDAYNKIRAWQELQNKPTFAQDLLAYNKELQLAVESLKKVVSLQIMILEQGQFESPTQYHERTVKIMVYSGGRDTSSDGNPILPIMIRHYIAGIWNQEIREQVESFAKSVDKPSLRAVARRHKSLQLALEFDRALAKGCYDASTVADVKAYVDVLRLPLQKCDQPGRRFDYVVPRTESTAPVISRARQLTDPSKMTPNQPRDPYRDRLEFPKTGAGVQCDINFSAHLALQNTLLLRCYSHTDPRVRPLVLFVKHWAKIRDINTPYRGTLSSYGYVLMMLHYLVNVAQPFVCPNLQQLVGPTPNELSPEEMEETVSCRGCDIRFWRNEEEIKNLAEKGMLNQNKDSVGYLLRGFFEYYAQSNFMSTVPCRGFDWGRDVLSLRTRGGLRSKQEKGWTGARTVVLVQDQAASPQSAVERPIGHTPSQSQSQLQTPTRAQGGEQDSFEATVKTPGADAGAGAGAGVTGTATPGSVADGVPGNKGVVTHKAVETKEVKHRYLFAIEDPFELDHNVARTVTHSGIVAIRDEFRRAWRIIKNLGKFSDENLLEDVTDNTARERDEFAELLNEIHGPELALR